MNSKAQMQIPLYKILEDNGWHNEDNQMYPPHGTFWISGNADLPIFMIEKMHEQAVNTFRKVSENSHFHPDKQKLRNWIEDLKSLIETTENIIVESQTKTI